MSAASLFDRSFYLSNNKDVAEAIENGIFNDALQHFETFGSRELRSPNPYFATAYYRETNADVVAAVDEGFFKNLLHHYATFGESENRIPSVEFEGFDAKIYLEENVDVANAIADNIFTSALEHFIKFGQFENRNGVSINSATLALTTQFDNLSGTFSGDLFQAAKGTLQAGDILDGKGGIDTLLIEENPNLELLSSDRIAGIENLAVTRDVQRTIDFSALSKFNKLEIIDGKTPETGNIFFTLGHDQSLELKRLKNGNTTSVPLETGSGVIIEKLEARSLNLGIDSVGPVNANRVENLLLDLAGPELTTLNLSVANTNSIKLINSGGNLSNLEIQGTGTLNIESLLSTITNIDASSSMVNFNISLPNNNLVLTLGGGKDFINFGSGQLQANVGAGDDTIIIRDSRVPTNQSNIEMGLGDDYVDVTGGTNIISLGEGNDAARLNRGSNTVQGEDGDDRITVVDGTNRIFGGLGNDYITINSGFNSINAEAGNDTIYLAGGTSEINTGVGDDTIIIVDGLININVESLDGADGTDTLNVYSNGNVTLPAFRNIENVFISDTVHQTLDFSFSSTLSGIELDSGSTVDGATITTTLGEGQSLTLDSITDGDTAAASLADGGIVIAQDASINSLDLTLDGVGPATSTPNENLFIDIAGTGVTTANVTSDNISFVVISNSGGALTELAILGSGTMALGTLPTSITNVNGGAASANLTLTIGSTGSNTITGGSGNDAITLTGGTNIVNTGDGDDTITASGNLTVGDRINGGNGTDTFEVIHTGLATIPSTANLTSIEQIAIQDTVHQSLDFSALTDITGIELDSGTTLDNATIVTTIGAGQSVTLDSITDGDTAAALLADGGIQITQANSVTSIDLTLDDIGPATASVNQNVVIDIAGTGVTTANVTSTNDSFIVLENSGGALSTLNLEGSGNLGIMSALANSVTNVNGASSTANLTLTPGTGGSSTTTGSGNDVIILTGGANTVNTNSGQDNITASGGTNNVNTGNGNDTINLTGGTNTLVTGNNNDTVTASAGNNDIDTNNGDDQVTLTGGTNDVNTGSNNDTVTLSGGTDTVDMGSGNDTVIAGANLSTSDTVNAGDGTGDTLEITSALTDALTALLSNFEILEIKGGGGVTHDITGLTGLTSLKASGALAGAVVITDLAEAAEVDISAALGNDLTINQINSAGGADTLTFDFSGSSLTTGGSIIAPNIETVTLKTSASGAKTMSGGTFADATNVTITATSANLTITDLTAVNMTALDASSSNRKVNITTGADIFAGAFTFSSGNRNDTLDLDGATLVAGSVFELGGRQDTLTLNSDAVATVVRTSVTDSDNAFSVRDDATTANTPSFTSGSDTFDYNGSLSHDSVTSVVVASGATLQAAVAADADATVYVIQDANGDEDLESAINNFADSVTTGEADTLETEAVDTGLLSYTGLDAAFDSSDIVLIAIDSETNEDATEADNGGTVVYRFQNSNTSTVDTVLSSELELIGVFQDAAFRTVDFV